MVERHTIDNPMLFPFLLNGIPWSDEYPLFG